MSSGHLLPPVQKLVATLIYSSPISSTLQSSIFLKGNQQSSGLPFVFEGLSHGLKSVHWTLFASHRSADLSAAYFIGSGTHLNADVQWASAATSSKTGGYLNLFESYIVQFSNFFQNPLTNLFLSYILSKSSGRLAQLARESA